MLINSVFCFNGGKSRKQSVFFLSTEFRILNKPRWWFIFPLVARRFCPWITLLNSLQRPIGRWIGIENSHKDITLVGNFELIDFCGNERSEIFINEALSKIWERWLL